MKNFLVLSVFVSTLILGLIFSDTFKLSGICKKDTHRSPVIQKQNELSKTYFTLSETNFLSGKKVISKNKDFRGNEIGRIISFEIVEADKFLVEIYWGKGVMDENSAVTFHDKTHFTKYFKVLD